MLLEAADEASIYYVAMRMRASDLREFLALSSATTREGLATTLAARFGSNPDVSVACIDGEPVAIGAMIEARPNVMTLFFFATDRFWELGVELTRTLKRKIMPNLKAQGVHRFECVSIEGHDEAHRWIRALGLQSEGGPLLGYGKNGETFYQFAWVAENAGKISN